MEDNCFTISCWFLPHINMNQPWIICPLPLEALSYLPPHPTPLRCHWFELPESYSKFPLSIYFIFGNVYVFMVVFQFIHSLLPPLFPQVCFLCLHLRCCHANKFMSTIFLDPTCIIDICVNIRYLSFSFWLFMVEYYPIVYRYHSFFTRSSVDGHLGCFMS